MTTEEKQKILWLSYFCNILDIYLSRICHNQDLATKRAAAHKNFRLGFEYEKFIISNWYSLYFV